MASAPPLTVVSCPFGFASMTLPASVSGFALTSFIPFPRLNTEKERARAKESPNGRIATDVLVAWARSLSTAEALLQQRERESLSSHLEALHEVRRLNHTVKVIMERLCGRASPKNPERADTDLVRAWKASEMISHHLDALDILSNPNLANQPPNKTIVLYKLVDQVQRIYQPRADAKKLSLRLTGQSVARAVVHDGTMHIVPSALIDNAIKYSPRGGDVEVHVFEGVLDNIPTVGFEVLSHGPTATAVEERRLFVGRGRGEAAKALAEGSGVGLVLVHSVAKQHHARASAIQKPQGNGWSEWCFRFEMPAAPS